MMILAPRPKQGRAKAPQGVDVLLAALENDDNDEAVYGWLAEESGPERDLPPSDDEFQQGPAGEVARRTVLVADDDDLVRGMITATLEDAGYEVVDVPDGGQAMTFLEKGDVEVAALVSDIRMPGIDGLELARTVAGRWPQVAIVLVSGYPTSGRMRDVPEAAVFVAKPFRLDELARAVERALAHKGSH